MNTMTKILVMAFSLFLLTANAHASKGTPGLSHASGSKTIEVPITSTKEKAYSLAFQELKRLTKLPSGEALSNELRLILNTRPEKNSVTIEEANMTVQELMNKQGEIVYKGMVNLTYHYSVKLYSH
jgi:hypothetical protein